MDGKKERKDKTFILSFIGTTWYMTSFYNGPNYPIKILQKKRSSQDYMAMMKPSVQSSKESPIAYI